MNNTTNISRNIESKVSTKKRLHRAQPALE
ncbi:uncharacterized protein G2W53_041284 [Senna tora]|uniref:Uncharacterized protein n=1 Tax=Senna tora TaxID=362788 RepID=A0A834VXU1_9FABA|nr:uncharacterized protein G2W53_041284 [Senna tora]